MTPTEMFYKSTTFANTIFLHGTCGGCPIFSAPQVIYSCATCINMIIVKYNIILLTFRVFIGSRASIPTNMVLPNNFFECLRRNLN